MKLFITVKDHKIQEPDFSNMLNSVEDGTYIVRLYKHEEFRTIADYRKWYFAISTEVAGLTGHTKNEMHEMFKEHAGIDSTKELSLQDWSQYIENVKWFVFNKFDILI